MSEEGASEEVKMERVLREVEKGESQGELGKESIAVRGRSES